VPLAPGLDWHSHEGLARARQEVERRLEGRGRVLIRASGTEPKLRLMVEAADEAVVDGCLDALSASLR